MVTCWFVVSVSSKTSWGLHRSNAASNRALNQSWSGRRTVVSHATVWDDEEWVPEDDLDDNDIDFENLPGAPTYRPKKSKKSAVKLTDTLEPEKAFRWKDGK